MSAYLKALCQGQHPVQYGLVEEKEMLLGRSQEADLSLSGEEYLSRRHAILKMEKGRLNVRRVPESANPIFHRGQEKEDFWLRAEEQFVIGKTRFLFSPPMVHEEVQPSTFLTLGEPELYQHGGLSDRLKLLDLLELPEILELKSSEESFAHIAGLLRTVTGAAWSQIFWQGERVLATDSSTDGGPGVKVSKALVEEALKQAPKPTLYCWSQPVSQDLQLTVQEGLDWAVCAACQPSGEEPLFFYVAGQAGSPQQLKDNCRLVGLIADMVRRSLSVRRLEGFKERLEMFFSGPIVSKILQAPNAGDLEPKLAEATVMFFDIRGFSKLSEGRAEKMLVHVDKLREVMTAMTTEIFKEHGVVLQFLGDGILACWNVPFSDPNHADQACRAALGMVAALEKIAPTWHCGIGIHSGEVVAGSMGARQLFSYTVMGPVVNQASRVEGITKSVEVPLLVTKEVADKINPETAAVRRVGRFQPQGMNVALDLFEVRPPHADQSKDGLFAKGLEVFENGDWEKAYEILDELPSSDRPARYLKSLAEILRRKPPKDWSGIIELSEK